MGMTLVLVSLGLAFLFGIFLSCYFFFYRLKIGRLLRWLGGIVGGLVVGTLMAIIDFWIIWPPVSIVSVVVGVALMLLIVKMLTGYPKLWQSDK